MQNLGLACDPRNNHSAGGLDPVLGQPPLPIVRSPSQNFDSRSFEPLRAQTPFWRRLAPGSEWSVSDRRQQNQLNQPFSREWTFVQRYGLAIYIREAASRRQCAVRPRTVVDTKQHGHSGNSRYRANPVCAERIGRGLERVSLLRADPPAVSTRTKAAARMVNLRTARAQT
jgi:hypothetical protein